MEYLKGGMLLALWLAYIGDIFLAKTLKTETNFILGPPWTNRHIESFLFYVMLPKVANASKEGAILRAILGAILRAILRVILGAILGAILGPILRAISRALTR